MANLKPYSPPPAWQVIAYMRAAEKIDACDELSLADLEHIIREAKEKAEKDAEIKRALQSGDDALVLKLLRRRYQLPEETEQ